MAPLAPSLSTLAVLLLALLCPTLPPWMGLPGCSATRSQAEGLVVEEHLGHTRDSIQKSSQHEIRGSAGAHLKSWIRGRSLLPEWQRKCDQNLSAALSTEDFNTVPKVIEWKPQKDMYLLPLCLFGGMSDQLACMRLYMHLAGYLGRTLVLPRYGFTGSEKSGNKWRWDAMFGAEHMKECLKGCCGGEGDEVGVITLEHYTWKNNKKCIELKRVVAIDEKLEPSSEALIHDLGLTDVCSHEAKVEAHRQPLDGKLLDKLRAIEDDVISLDTLRSVGEPGVTWGLKAPFKVSEECGDLYDPDQKVLDFVYGFVATIIGPDYAALHYRRHPPFHSDASSGLSLAKVAEYVVTQLATASVSTLYVVTDGSPVEMQTLETQLHRLRAAEDPLVVIRMPMFKVESSAQFGELKWVKELAQLEEGSGAIIRSLAEKYVCAQAKVFIGSNSSFSHDVHRIRRARGTASCWDVTLVKKTTDEAPGGLAPEKETNDEKGSAAVPPLPPPTPSPSPAPSLPASSPSTPTAPPPQSPQVSA